MSLDKKEAGVIILVIICIIIPVGIIVTLLNEKKKNRKEGQISAPSLMPDKTWDFPNTLRIEQITIDSCQYLTFGNEHMLHKANCTNHKK